MWGEKSMNEITTSKHRANGDPVEMQTCIVCESGNATRSLQIQEFEYGTGKSAALLHARVPVWTCADCGLQYVDHDGEIAQHAAVCRHLGRLAPGEIKAIRMSAQLSQAAFATAIGAGKASVVRWESGRLIQNRSMDHAIRNFQADRKRAIRPQPKFRTAIGPEVTEAAATFRLRRFQPEAMAA